MYLLNDCSSGGWDIFGEACLASVSDGGAGAGVWWQVGVTVAPDNPKHDKEEDWIKWAPELVGTELRGPGRPLG